MLRAEIICFQRHSSSIGIEPGVKFQSSGMRFFDHPSQWIVKWYPALFLVYLLGILTKAQSCLGKSIAGSSDLDGWLRWSLVPCNNPKCLWSPAFVFRRNLRLTMGPIDISDSLQSKLHGILWASPAFGKFIGRSATGTLGNIFLECCWFLLDLGWKEQWVFWKELLVFGFYRQKKRVPKTRK